MGPTHCNTKFRKRFRSLAVQMADRVRILHGMIPHALTRGGGIFWPHGCYDFVRIDQGGRDLSDVLAIIFYYFVRMDQKGWNLLGVMDVTILYA